MKKKIALITGITGQDGSYLAEFLLNKGYEVHGLVRWLALENPASQFQRVSRLVKSKKIIVHWGDIQNYQTIWKLIADVKPDEIYHLAAVSAVGATFADEFGAFNADFNSVHYLLSAIRVLRPTSKFYFAGSSEMFGAPKISPQNEETPLAPISPYAIAKTAGFHLVKMYREAYGIFACTGITYNHESPRRGSDFITRKITLAAAKIKLGLTEELRLGDLKAKRDWGFAGDYVEAFWLMLQAKKPDDYVIGTGKLHSVQDILEIAFGEAGLDWRKYVIVDKKLLRKEKDRRLVADIAKIKRELKWRPKVSFEDLIKMMVQKEYE